MSKIKKKSINHHESRPSSAKKVVRPWPKMVLAGPHFWPIMILLCFDESFFFGPDLDF